MTALALIPARGGSKGIPRKNIRPLLGRPLIAWTIDAALASGAFARVVVSTEDEEIASVAASCGADVPFRRPMELATDGSGMLDTVVHALHWLETHDRWTPTHVMLLQPTSPMRNAADICAAVEIAATRDAGAVVSVCEVHQHPYWCKTLTQEGLLTNLLPGIQVPDCRQDLPRAYATNGALFLTKREALLDQRTFYPARCYPYVMPPERSLDIDSPWDWSLAEFALSANGQGAAP